MGRVFLRAVSRWSRSPGCCGFLWCVLGGVDFFVFFFSFFFFFEHTRPTASMRSPCLIYLSTSNEAVFCLQAKKASSYRGAYRVPLFNGLSVCRCVCNIRRFYCLRELYEADFHKPGMYGSGRVWANAWDVFHRMLSRVGRGRRAAVALVVCFRWGGFFRVFLLAFFFFERTQPAASVRPPCLIYPSTTCVFCRERQRPPAQNA